MRRFWVLCSLIPVVGFCGELEDDYLFLAEEQDRLLQQYIADECDLESERFNMIDLGDFDDEVSPLSSMGFDEEIDPLLPWSMESIVSEPKLERHEEIDEAYSYEQNDYKPTYERVPKRTSHFAARPKIVQSKSENAPVKSKKAKRSALKKKKRAKSARAHKKPITILKNSE